MAALPGNDSRPGIFGPGALGDLPRIVQDLGLGRVLLVTGKASFAASGGAEVLPGLSAVSTVETWSAFSPNPEIEDVIAGSRIVQSFRPDGIVAIGGGSVLDMAKLLAVLGDKDPEQLRACVRTNDVPHRARGLILVPTTSGSGSEATHFAVAYIGPEKFSVAGAAMLPDFVILDPVLTESASRFQKATSVIDAIAQAVESHWARAATVESRSFAQAALTDLLPAAPGFLDGDRAATVLAARGSYLAGRAIDLSKTTGAHALAYGLTTRHGISHGHAVSTTLGAFARLHAAAASTGQGSADLRQDMESIARLVGADGTEQIGDRLDAIAVELGLELKLGALGVPRADLAPMAGAVNAERLGNNPIDLTGPGIESLLESCW